MKEFESVTKFNVQTIEVAGFAAAMSALRLPYGKEVRSHVETQFNGGRDGYVRSLSKVSFDEKDVKLLTLLIKNGDEHAKVLRGVVAYCEVNAPRYFHQELDTYRIGAERLGSESTMHIQGQGLTEEELVEMKENLPEGTMQKRVWMFSYQTLRRIYLQRGHHRLPQWREFCKWIETLPMSDAFITIGIKD